MKNTLLTISVTLLLSLLLSSTSFADKHRDFCKKFKKNYDLSDCIDNQITTKSWLEDNGYVESVVSKCKNRYIRNDRVVTYIDYAKAYKCVKGNPNRWKKTSSSSRRTLNTN